jgi:hypothetical protein
MIPLVSLFMPAGNQVSPNTEVFLVNDGSTGQTLPITTRFASKFVACLP